MALWPISPRRTGTTERARPARSPYALGCRRRQLSDEPQRHRQLVQLEVRLEIRDGAVTPRLAGNVEHVHARLAQRIARLQLLPRVVRQQDVVGDPAVEEALDVAARH